jgi:hypothetical protein
VEGEAGGEEAARSTEKQRRKMEGVVREADARWRPRAWTQHLPGAGELGELARGGEHDERDIGVAEDG